VHNRRVAKNVDDGGQKWSEELVRRIGAAMKAARGDRTAKWLSDRTHELGYRVSPTVIAKLDSGHRGNVLSVPELLIIAAALEVPAVALLFPGLPDEPTERLPGQTTSAVAAMLWFTGEYSDSDLGQLLKLSRDRFLQKAKLKLANDRVHEIAAKAGSDAEVERAAEMILAVIDDAEEIRKLERKIAAIPGAAVADEDGSANA
jgi:hypothetical protein